MNLKKILDDHEKWLNGENGGRRANFRDANCQGANFQGANFRDANCQGANFQGADFWGADCQGANFRGANFQGADLRGVNLDFSCWPLWCGSKGVKVDLKIVYQLLAHVACLDCEDKEFIKIKKAIMKYAIRSHRAKDLELPGV